MQVEMKELQGLLEQRSYWRNSCLDSFIRPSGKPLGTVAVFFADEYWRFSWEIL